MTHWSFLILACVGCTCTLLFRSIFDLFSVPGSPVARGNLRPHRIHPKLFSHYSLLVLLFLIPPLLTLYFIAIAFQSLGSKGTLYFPLRRTRGFPHASQCERLSTRATPDGLSRLDRCPVYSSAPAKRYRASFHSHSGAGTFFLFQSRSFLFTHPYLGNHQPRLRCVRTATFVLIFLLLCCLRLFLSPSTRTHLHLSPFSSSLPLPGYRMYRTRR